MEPAERFPRTESLAKGAPVDAGGLPDHGHVSARRTIRVDQSTPVRVLVHRRQSGRGTQLKRMPTALISSPAKRRWSARCQDLFHQFLSVFIILYVVHLRHIAQNPSIVKARA